MKAKIMIIEDEESIVTLVKYNLEKEGYKVFSNSNGEKAIEHIKEIAPDLILLDWMLPNLSGIEICKILKTEKKYKHIPIIMLTAKGEEEDKIRGLNSGADDYITKPFSHKELIARVNALLRRVNPSVSEDIVEYEDLKVDRIERKVFREKKEIKLGPTEFKLLNFLIKNPKRVYSREQLLENIWSDNINVENRTIDVHIRRLRQAININSKKNYIRTVRSAGYALD
jgi:two-component system, OmpR family, phosphate regulon response regulator PhoB